MRPQAWLHRQIRIVSHSFPGIGERRYVPGREEIIMVTSPIADMLIRIKNAQAVRHDQVSMPFSTMKLAIAGILKEAGYVSTIERKKKSSRPAAVLTDKPRAEHEYLVLSLKYHQGLGAINGMKMISVPSRRMYVKADAIKSVRSGHGLSIISTSKGMMSSREAKKQGLGGEIICEVW